MCLIVACCGLSYVAWLLLVVLFVVCLFFDCCSLLFVRCSLIVVYYFLFVVCWAVGWSLLGSRCSLRFARCLFLVACC